MNRSGKGLIKLLIVLAVIAAVVVGGLYFTFRTGKSVKVPYTSSDLKTYTDKTGVTFNANSAGYQDFLTGKFKPVGSKLFKGFISSAEFTAVINKTAGADVVYDNSNPGNIAVIGATRNLFLGVAGTGPFTDFAISFHAGSTVELSFTVGDDIESIYTMIPEAKAYDKFIKMAVGSPVYIKFDLKYVGGNKFEAKILAMKLGVIPLPVDLVNTYGTLVGTALNDMLAKMEGLRIDKFEIVEGGFNFEGMIPESIVKTP